MQRSVVGSTSDGNTDSDDPNPLTKPLPLTPQNHRRETPKKKKRNKSLNDKMEISGPTDIKHLVHVVVDPLTGAIHVSMPGCRI